MSKYEQSFKEQVTEAYRILSENAIIMCKLQESGKKNSFVSDHDRARVSILLSALEQIDLPGFEKAELACISDSNLSWDWIRIVLNRSFVYLKIKV